MSTLGKALVAGSFERPAWSFLELFVRGDSTRDGVLDVSDPIVILNFLFLGGASPDCVDAIDVDDNGYVNISDSIWTLNFLFLGGPSPAPPFPEPGVDPTQDSLDC